MRQVLIYPGESGFWVAECPSLPGCVSQGETKEAAIHASNVMPVDPTSGKPTREVSYPGLQLPGSFPGGTDFATSPSGHIVDELNGVQGEPVELGGYYHVDRDKADAAMRPSQAFNAVIDAM